MQYQQGRLRRVSKLTVEKIHSIKSLRVIGANPTESRGQTLFRLKPLSFPAALAPPNRLFSCDWIQPEIAYQVLAR